MSAGIPQDPWILAGICFCASLIAICVVVAVFGRPRRVRNRRIPRNVGKPLPAPVADDRSSLLQFARIHGVGQSYRGSNVIDLASRRRV